MKGMSEMGLGLLTVNVWRFLACFQNRKDALDSGARESAASDVWVRNIF